MIFSGILSGPEIGYWNFQRINLFTVRLHKGLLMITKEKLIPMLVEAIPSFRSIREDHLKEYDEEIPYVLLGDLARHLLELHHRNETVCFSKVAQVIELLYKEGNPYVREAVTVGLLEGIQNVWGNNGVNPELFLPYLLPESAKWWNSLNKFWNGKSKFVGEGL